MKSDLFEWNPEGVDAWREAAPGGRRVLLQSLRGFIDAGQAGRVLTRHIRDESTPVRVASFDIDRLLDYRSRRPEMVFSVNEWTSYDEPYLRVDMVTDAAGAPFLLLHGFEPDVLWEGYIRAVKEIVDELGVTLVAGVHGIPMAVPHTRPLTATVHGTNTELLPDSPSLFGTVTVPASATNLLEYRFGQWERDVVNVAVHVPHYLAQSAYPQAAIRAIESLEPLTDLKLSPEALEDDAREATDEIARQAEESDEVQAVVAALEEQYDSVAEAQEGVVGADGLLPTADEIGAEFEKFLADRGGDYPGA